MVPLFINVSNLTSLFVSRVVNRNIGQLGVSGWVINAGNRILTWRVTRNSWNINVAQAVVLKRPAGVDIFTSNFVVLTSPRKVCALVFNNWRLMRHVNRNRPTDGLSQLTRISNVIHLRLYLNDDWRVLILKCYFARNVLTRY